MKYIRILLFSLFLAPSALFAATNDFTIAAQLLSAAKNADIQQVQILINNGANVNYVDSTGLSIVCTALMNNDIRAAQILQMYGADASKCDQQIKQYKNRTTTESSGGLFSGLSSAQGMALAAAGAAVVVGGLFLLTDVLDPGNENAGSSSGGTRPGGDGGGSDSGATASGTIPVGPAYFTSTGEISYSQAAYLSNLQNWDPSAGGIREADFNYFRPSVQTSNNYVTGGITVPMQNYLLMMHGYSAFANGYMGQATFRDESNNPVKILNQAGGGKPMLVSLITANGVNPTGSAGRGYGITYSDSASANSNTYTVDKYANYSAPCVEGETCGAELVGYDLSGSGTAMNPFATANENALAKIVAGWEAGGRAYGDLYGFVPNGQLAVYRTGNGYGFVDVQNPTQGAVVGTLTDSASGGTANTIEAGDSITLNGKTYTIAAATTGAGVTNPTIEINGTTYNLVSESSMMIGTCTSGCGDDETDIAIYVGTDGYYYVNTSGKNTIDAVYVVNNNNIYVQKKWQEIDVMNFQAMYNARNSGSAAIANAVLNPESRSTSYLTTGEMASLFALNSGLDTKTVFMNQINSYYDNDDSGTTTQGGYANTLFNGYNSSLPILVMPAGEFEYGVGDGKSLTVLDATFENYAPALYDDNLEHLFMTVVAVQHSKGTSGADSIEDYGNGTGSAYGPIYLSMWQDNKGTDTTDDDVIYSSRKCGLAGLGINGIDPWCFSAAGPTAEMATASAAGAVAALKGAFNYMNNQQIFTLLALTADGPYLGTTDAGTSFTTDTLVAYLKSMYSLPPDYYADNLTGQAYLDAFAEVYGYGLINLERAMTPGHAIYYYNGNTIVSDSGNAYWRAASNTIFRPSAALSPSTARISAPFFDFLESVDGDMSLPRIWKNDFALGVQDKRGLYMGDVLGDFKTRKSEPNKVQFGDFGFSMAVSEKPYADNLNGLDNMRLDYSVDNWNLAAEYQRYFTDGASRFDGMSNPVLGLASNAITSDIVYNMGKWSFGTRAFSGAITDEELLDNDPTVSSQYNPARLGLMQGMQSDVSWNGEKFGFKTSIGTAHETDTLLGAQSGGLLNMGQGNTSYVDSEIRYSPYEKLNFTLRSTFAHTESDASGQFILGLSDIESNAFAFGIDAGNFSFSVSQPLTVSKGSLQYAYADYEIVEVDGGKYDLVVNDTHIENVDLSPDAKELRFVGTYRHNFGPWTDGAIGFIYRVNPNNTSEFGNESIFMMKLNHRLGI